MPPSKNMIWSMSSTVPRWHATQLAEFLNPYLSDFFEAHSRGQVLAWRTIDRCFGQRSRIFALGTLGCAASTIFLPCWFFSLRHVCNRIGKLAITLDPLTVGLNLNLLPQGIGDIKELH